MERPHSEAWVCPEGHILSPDPREPAHANVVVLARSTRLCPLSDHKHHVTAYIPCRPIEAFPAVHAAWLLGRIEATTAMWRDWMWEHADALACAWYE